MRSNNKFYERYWEKEAPPEKDSTTPIRIKFLLNTFDKLKIEKGKVLDAGCGSGYFCKLFKDMKFEVSGIDISEKAINKAKSLYPEIGFSISILDDSIPYPNNSFEIVWSSEVVEHIFDVYEYLKEINRVLKIGGYYILSTPYHGLIKNILIVLLGFEKHFCNIESGHIRFFTNKHLCKLLYKFGFEVIESRYIGKIPPIAKSVYIVAKKIKDAKIDFI